MHRQGNLVEAVAGGADDSAHLTFPLFERFEIGNPMIVHHPRKRMIDAVIDMVVYFPLPPRFSDYLRDQCRGRGYDESARLRNDFGILRKEPVEFGVQYFRQPLEPGDVRVVGHGETSPDIDDAEPVSLVAGVMADFGRYPQRGGIVIAIGALAPHVKAQALNRQSES